MWREECIEMGMMDVYVYEGLVELLLLFRWPRRVSRRLDEIGGWKWKSKKGFRRLGGPGGSFKLLWASPG